MNDEPDIFSVVPEDKMTLAQLTFRRNGRVHAVNDAKRSGSRSQVAKARQALASAESLLAKKIVSK